MRAWRPIVTPFPALLLRLGRLRHLCRAPALHEWLDRLYRTSDARKDRRAARRHGGIHRLERRRRRRQRAGEVPPHADQEGRRVHRRLHRHVTAGPRRAAHELCVYRFVHLRCAALRDRSRHPEQRWLLQADHRHRAGRAASSTCATRRRSGRAVRAAFASAPRCWGRSRSCCRTAACACAGGSEFAIVFAGYEGAQRKPFLHLEFHNNSGQGGGPDRDGQDGGPYASAISPTFRSS